MSGTTEKTPAFAAGPWAALRTLFADQGRLHWRSYVLGFALMIVFSGSTGLIAYLIGDVINGIFVEKNYDALYWLSGAVVAVFAMKGLSLYLQSIVMARVGNRIVADVQRRLYAHMLVQDLNFYQNRHSTAFLAQISFITRAARDALNTVITGVGRDLATLIFLMGVVIWQDPIMSAVGIIVLPLSALGIVQLMRQARKIITTEFGAFAKVMEFTQETAQGIRVVKSYQLEDALRARMDEHIDALERANNNLVEVNARANPLMELLGGIAVGLVLMYGGYRVIVDGQTPGQFFSFLTAFLLAYEPAKRLARFQIDLRSQLVGVEMLYRILSQPGREADGDGGPALTVTQGEVIVDHVSFSYPGADPVLHGVSFTAPAGKTTALVGHSGGGKSTIMALLQRFFRPSKGRILIDGQDLARVSLRSARMAIATVSQDVWLFSGTIRENIAIGRSGASESDVIAAARAAGAHEFIDRMPHGLDTAIGEQGVKLSGGQRQRLSIARAILKDAPILLLDEATAALDSETERAVQDALDRLRTGRTMIVIAHRLQTVMNADKICVIEHGRVVEEGTHDELLRRRGRYYHYHSVQLRDQTAA